MCTIHITQEQLAGGEGKKMKCEMFLLPSLPPFVWPAMSPVVVGNSAGAQSMAVMSHRFHPR